jgi:hypothetical protein
MVVERLGGFGVSLSNPATHEIVELTADGRNVLTGSQFGSRLAEPDAAFTFQLWLGASIDVVVTLRRAAVDVVNFDLDGLDISEQNAVCAAVLWSAVTNDGTRLLVLGSYLDDVAQEWDDFAIHRGPRPSPVRLVLEHEPSRMPDWKITRIIETVG